MKQNQTSLQPASLEWCVEGRTGVMYVARTRRMYLYLPAGNIHYAIA